jgi:glycosyltransferase involved in cell wall biosynthesis
MKILYIHSFYKERGGEDVVFENEVRMMKESGHEVETLLFYNAGWTAVMFLIFFFNPVSFLRTWRAVGRFRPDIVHIHNWFFGASPSVFLAARWRGTPAVHTIHNFRILCPSAMLFHNNDVFTDSVHKVFPTRAISKRVYRNSGISTLWLLAGIRLHYFMRTWQSIEKFICLTAASKKVLCDSFLRISPEKVAIKPHFLPWTTPQEMFRHSPEATSGRGGGRTGDFLYVGRLSPEKGIGLMLEAFGKCDLPLRVIGDGPLRGAVEEASRVHPNITYLGFRNKEDIVREMCSCTALVLATTGFEQFGMVIIEAFFCGTAVIVPDHGSPAELVTPGFNGLHFHTGSSDDLGARLRDWCALAPDARRHFSENAEYTYTNHYTLPDNADQLLAIYKSLHHEKNADTQFPDQHRQVPGLH